MTEINAAAGLKQLCAGLPVDPLPPARPRDKTLPHAPVRVPQLNTREQKVHASSRLLVATAVAKKSAFKPRQDYCLYV